MLMVGAAGRDAGKTEFACQLVSRLAPHHQVVAVKVSTETDEHAHCACGGEGCGGCSAPFQLSLESAGPAGKDTARLRRAGAQRVYWLQVLRGHLEAGARALLDKLDPDTVVVCESNSLRTVVEPGVFVIATRAGVRDVKPSCRAVWHLADAILRSDGERFDPPADRFALQDGRWGFRREAAAIVMAGGQSRRMGRDKTLLRVGGKPMVQRVIERVGPLVSQVLVSANDPAKFAFLGLEVVPDREPGHGPLMGLVSTLPRSRYDLNLVLSCDVPGIPPVVLRELLRIARGGADVVVPVTAEGFYEPLCAVYRKRAVPVLEGLLAGGMRSVHKALHHLSLAEVPVADLASWQNLNTLADLQAFSASEEA